jgi:ligand-binding sensor domain-containing protein
VLEHYLKSQYPNAFSSDTISKLMAIDNKIWMLTQAGISVYDAQTKITKEVDKFSNKGFNKLIDYFGVDKNGYYWLSGEDYIVRGSPPTSLLPISNASSKIEKNTRVVFRDSKGDYWFGTGDKGVFVKHDTVWKNYKFQTGNIFQDFFVNSIFDIKQDTTGKIWVATYNNIFTFDGQNWSDLGYFGDGAKVIHFDKKNRAWIASSYGLMVPRANGIGWSRYHQDVTPDKFKGFYAFDLAFEGDSTVWVSTGGGITRLQLPDSTWTNWTNVQLGNKSSLRNILVHEKGKVWVATDSSGIMEFNGTNIKYYNTQNSGINHNWIWKMQQDTTGTIWFATQQGLSKLNKNNEWQSFDGTNSPFYTYTGLMDSRTTTRQGSADVNFMSIDRSGYIWLVQNRSIGLFTYFTGNITPTNEIPMSEKYSPLFKIYPNPNKGSFTIDLLSNEQGNIEILNTMGVSIYKIPISQQSFSIHLPFLTKGLYFLRLQTLKGFDVQKMVVD